MQRATLTFCSLSLAAFAAVLTGCNGSPVEPASSVDPGSQVQALTTATPAAVAVSIRLRCERRPSRSRISVDASGLVPGNGRFRARVTAAGGTVTSPLKRALGGQAEFDFDSNPNDIRAGATAIPATFIRARTGPDVVAKVMNAAGQVIATRGAECAIR